MELYFNDSMQTVYACVGSGGGSQQREVADGADVVFTDTANRLQLNTDKTEAFWCVPARHQHLILSSPLSV